MNDEDFEQQPTEQPEQDPLSRAIESIQLGSQEEAANALRGVIHAEADIRDRWRAINAEQEHSQKVLGDFLRENEQFRDEDISALGHQAVVRLQREDVSQALDLVGWEKLQNRQATPQEIAAWHLELRAAKNPKARGPQALLEAASQRLSEKFGVKPSAEQIQRQRSSSVVNRINARNQALGRPPHAPLPEREEQPQDYSPADEHTVEQDTRRGFGDVGGEPTGAPDRARAFKQIAARRLALRGSRPTDHFPEE